MPLEAAELLALALALEEDDVDDDRAVEELAAGAEGSPVALTAAHAHAASLARALPYDERAQRTVALLQQALLRVGGSLGTAEHTPEEAEAWLRGGRGRRPGDDDDGATAATRLARLAAGAEERRDTSDLVAELDRLRDSGEEDEADEGRRPRWWRP